MADALHAPAFLVFHGRFLEKVDNVIIMRANIDNVNHSEEVLELVHAVMHQVRAQQHQTLRDSSELTPMEARVLRFFGRQPGATQSALAQHSGRDKAQLARLVKGLRDRGLLVVQSDPDDRRLVGLAPSVEGEVVCRKLRQLERKLAAQAVQGFDAAEEEQLRALLQRVRANLRA
jgi:DNA-binding MarR family transcriptional regulator